MVMLEVVHVTKRYRKVLANDDINLTKIGRAHV